MPDADIDARAERWALAVRRDALQWRSAEPCLVCGEWVGHFGGSIERDPCACIPQGVPLKEVRPNCYRVRQFTPSIAGAIRSMRP